MCQQLGEKQMVHFLKLYFELKKFPKLITQDEFNLEQLISYSSNKISGPKNNSFDLPSTNKNIWHLVLNIQFGKFREVAQQTTFDI